MMRFAPIARIILIALLPFGLRAEEISLSLPQARALAEAALARQDYALAVRMGQGLLEANRRDTGAWYLVAAAQAGQGNPRAARAAVTRAYRFAQTPGDKTRAAELAARFAVREGRPTMAQAWLRRAAIHIDTPEQEARLAADYRALRRINPWSFALRTDVRPSNNVNGGSSAVYNVIDDVIAPDFPLATQALEGTVASVDARVGYRLRASASSATTLGGRLYVQRVKLAGSARAVNPLARDSDYGATWGEISLHHGFQVQGGTAAVELTLGESWYGDLRNFRSAELAGERNWRIGTASSLQLNARVERRFDARSTVNEATGLGVGAFYSHRFADDGRFGLSLALRDTRAESINGTYSSASLRASYAFGRKIGPARLTLALGAEMADYPLFRLSGAIPATRREDVAHYGEVSLFFPDFDYAGFAPTLSLRAGERSSNFSQYTNREVSVALGVQSKF
ncbi:MAG: hypothetical protein KDK24_20625 [Pseudooceanicola sp.]|nr:hypothetical protein [Pseudooceanicola sp.]